MNKLNTVNQNINFYLKNQIIKLFGSNKLVYLICLLFGLMVFGVVSVIYPNPSFIRAKSQSQPCFNTLNQYEICYAEYVATPVILTSSASKPVLLTQPTPVIVAQNTPVSPDDFLTSTPTKSEPKPVEPTPSPTPTPEPAPKPVEIVKSTPASVQVITSPVSASNNPTSQSPISSSVSSSEPSASTSNSTSSSSLPRSQSVPEFGLGQAGAVASINTTKSNSNNSSNNNNWNVALAQNWIYITAGIVGLILLTLVFMIVRAVTKKNKKTQQTVINNPQAPDLVNLTYRLDNMPPEVDMDFEDENRFDDAYESDSQFGGFEASNIPTFDGDNLNFDNAQNLSSHPFEPINPTQELQPVPQLNPQPIPANNNSSSFSSLIQERLKQAKPKPTPIDPVKQALARQLWNEYNQHLNGKKSRPFPLTNKDRQFFAYCLAYTTVKVYVVDWDLWGED